MTEVEKELKVLNENAALLLEKYDNSFLKIDAELKKSIEDLKLFSEHELTKLDEASKNVLLQIKDISAGIDVGSIEAELEKKKQEILDAYASLGDILKIDSIEGLTEKLAGKASSSHTHNEYLSKTSPTILSGSLKEKVYSGLSTVLSHLQGSIHIRTLNANITFALPVLNAGNSLTLRVVNGDTHAVTWNAGITWVGGEAPTLEGNDIIVFWKDSSIVYGAYIGAV